MTEQLRVEVAVSVDGGDAQAVDEQTRLLRRDMSLQGLDPQRIAADSPEGARGTAELLGIVQLMLLPTFGPKLLDILQTWVAGRKSGATLKLKVTTPQRSIDLEYNPKQTSWSEIEALLNATTRGGTEG